MHLKKADYPLVTAKKVPVAPYRYILNNPGIKTHLYYAIKND